MPQGPPDTGQEPPPDLFLDRLLANVTLPRVLCRAAECVLLSQVEFPRPILDVGCGDGTFAAALFDEPVDVGLDPWRSQVEYSRRFSAYRLLVEASGERMPFPNDTFGSVMSNSTLEHTDSPAAILTEMFRVARPGATCVVTVPSEHFPRYLLGSSLFEAVRLKPAAKAYGAFMNRVSRHVHIEPPSTWSQWLEGAGFRILDWRYYFSRRDTMLLDLAHYLSIPSLITRRLTGRWVLFPNKHRLLPYTRLLAPFARPGDDSRGAYLFFHCRKP